MKKFLTLVGVAALISLVFAQSAKAPVLTVGNKAPTFTLNSTLGKATSTADFKGKYIVLEWTNHQCPFVVKHYSTGNMQGVQKWATEEGAVWLTINSSAKGMEGSVTNEQANALMEKQGYNCTAMLMDSNGTVGKMYGATRTPHIFIINPEGNLIYQGAIDDNPSPDPKVAKTAKNYVRQALTEAMAGDAVSTPTSTAYGCSVKYAN